jgi:hypothetical protein
MAKIQNAKAKNSTGSYARVFDNKALGKLITRIQDTVIANGSELEKLILSHISNEHVVQNCDKFLQNFQKIGYDDDVIKLIPKKVLKESKTLKPQKNPNNKNFEPDFVILKIDSSQQCCYIIELKDGFVFDTKKVIGEREHLELFENYIAKQIPFATRIKFCCFNENDKEKIKVGLKSAFEVDEIMTGIKFCELIKIDYNKILEIRKNDGIENFHYFIDELLEIDEVRKQIVKKLEQI